MVRWESDGNGGVNINVQKRHLKKYWWVPLLFSIAGSGGGGVVADRLLGVFSAGESNAAAIEVVDDKVEDLRRDVRVQIDGLKDGQKENLTELRALRDDVMQLYVKENNQ